MSIIGIIPARFGSTRFPGKPIHPIAGKPLIQWVVERCKAATRLDRVVVATDDQRIAQVVEPFCEVSMTRSDHPSGTDRIAEVMENYPHEAAVNIQGDEPLIEPEVIDRVAAELDRFEMSTAATTLNDVGALRDPNVVKAIVSSRGSALYFTRSPSPCVRDAESLEAWLDSGAHFQHLGIYGYRRATLERIVTAPESPLEKLERLEQLRALELGIEIGVAKVSTVSLGVDTPADVARAEKRLLAL